MPILSDFVSTEAPLIVALISAFICLAAFVCSFAVARRDSRHHFETMVEECLMPISVFIQDSFLVLSNKRFTNTQYIHDGENRLVEGLHKLQVFALTNGYIHLEEAAHINYGDEQKNLKCFSYCLLKLEDAYIKYRDSHLEGAISKKDTIKIFEFNGLFQDYLRLLSKYLFEFKKKKIRFIGKAKYYSSLAALMERSKQYGA